MTTATARSLSIGGRRYPVVLPSLNDPRLHLAAVIVSIHVIGQVGLGFRVSIPQILVAIVTCAAIEAVWTFTRERRLVWPASAMLTGSGVALILRLVGMQRGDYWSWDGWWIFALVAGFSLLSKYLIRWHGTHVFNPSNFGLVVAFLVVGSNVIEPLDFWWGPLDAWLVASYVIIIIGGVLITGRLGMVAMAATFWLAFAAFLAVLAGSGHCMTTTWAIAPVCGSEFWRIVALSPEVLIFLFFMITDPKTIPEGRFARLLFAASIAALSALLIAPQTQEFGAKVALLGGLVLLTPLRRVFDRILPEGSTAVSNRRTSATPRYAFGVGSAIGATLVVAAVGMVAAGAAARPDDTAQVVTGAVTVAVDIDPSTLPTMTVNPEVEALNGALTGDPQALAVVLAEDLAIEGMAMRREDTSMLRSADTGERLVQMEQAIEQASTLGRLVVEDYAFDSLHLDVTYLAEEQAGASLAVDGSGTVTNVVYDASGAEIDRTSEPFHSRFVITPGSNGRWVVARVAPVG